MAGAGKASESPCIFCQIVAGGTSTTLLHQDDRVVAFQDINPSAFRHYLVIPNEHIGTVKDLQRKPEHYTLVSHMLDVGKSLLQRDAPASEERRFGFHQPPFNSVNHLHLHCLALPFVPRWKQIKYTPLGPLGGFIEAAKLLEKIKPRWSCRKLAYCKVSHQHLLSRGSHRPQPSCLQDRGMVCRHPILLRPCYERDY